MGKSKFYLIFTLSCFVFTLSSALLQTIPALFADCLVRNSPSADIGKLFYPHYSPSYSSILESTVQNLKFNSSSLQPFFIITPYNVDDVRSAVICTQNFNLQLRVRSGGHDYEGLSYKANAPFVLVDLVNLRRVSVDLENQTAWVQSGTTLGELYYQIGNRSQELGFPAGTCPTIGVGGHFSGGGKGTLTRSFGLAADNVLDAVLVTAKGEILNRTSMEEEVFWAIRGGGGASFGVIVDWKIRLSPIPEKVTVFTISKTLQQNATEIIYKWQEVAPELPKELFIRLVLTIGKDSQGNTTVMAIFRGLYLGNVNSLVSLINKKLPELGLATKQCQKMSWLESILFFDRGLRPGESVSILMDRNRLYTKGFFKAKSDFVTQPITHEGLEEIWKVIKEGDSGVLILDPFGGKMNEIPDSETPFPFRNGTLYSIQYFTSWRDPKPEVEMSKMEWINRVYNAMTPYVSMNPRTAYLNYRDLSIGMNAFGKHTYFSAKLWGEKYFKGNFPRLAQAKAKVDPFNFFKNEQSIPPLWLNI
ncbi:berberine bridge enzyme-like 24 [Carica papaya]|uniref:berberine bridge enzyme-like 24 n=1 Tax=Carica papaya TaxID=3649 RepID=UPI000B8CCBF7|nr:berberine bridge enzyme-like 24 [Carica papaya]